MSCQSAPGYNQRWSVGSMVWPPPSIRSQVTAMADPAADDGGA
ncbi:unnamed protein product [Staurois parvus]|uniref:Uncharacterized protein n=1 Tax=Staurois parvus TaxID=386267 RepID=A0ABN9E9I5_9NEOB|nr:unnamed protein product [Staurois parvus]